MHAEWGLLRAAGTPCYQLVRGGEMPPVYVKARATMVAAVEEARRKGQQQRKGAITAAAPRPVVGHARGGEASHRFTGTGTGTGPVPVRASPRGKTCVKCGAEGETGAAMQGEEG